MKKWVPYALAWALTLCAGVSALGEDLSARPQSPAQATLSGTAFDRAALAGEVLSAVKGKGVTEVIVTLAQSDPVAQAAGMSAAAQRGELRARNRAAAGEVLGRLSAGDFRERNRFDNFAGFTGTVSEEGLKKLLADPAVKFVEPIRMLEPHLAQGIPLMNATAVRTTHNGSGLSVAICDTGIDYTHPRLGGGGFPNSKVLGGYDYGDNDANPMPDSEAHGTCCAGIAAGDLGTVGSYIGGVAYNAKLYALKMTAGSSGSATNAAMVSSWDWCVTHQNDNPSYPIMVISTSFGGGRYYSTASGDAASPSMTTAANNAVAAGITVLASAGNDGYCDSMGWPACVSSVISVGAVYDANFGTYYPCVNSASCAAKTADSGCGTGYYSTDATAADKVTSYSNSAPFLTLFAPSNSCYTLDIVGSTGYSSGDYDASFGGTSAACPYAAGAVACLQSAAKAVMGRWLTVAEVRSALASTGVGVTDGKVAVTKPRINLAAAVDTLFDVHGFTWAPVSSPQTAGAPFSVTVTAVDGGGSTVTDFGGTANLSGLVPGPAPVTIGAGTGTANFPMGAYYHDERTQVIYLAGEIGGARPISSLSLYVGAVPGQILNGWTIRMKHTALGAFASASWEGSGWTTVYQASETVSATGWVQFNFTTPFSYDGVNNLMVDFSFNNTSYTSNGTCRYSTPGGYRTVWYQTDSGAGDPLTWSGASPSGTRSTSVPNIKFGAPDTPVSITPAVSGSFVNGVWTGSITVPDGVAGMLLRADDGSGHKGDSNTFNVAAADTTPPTGTLVINGGAAHTGSDSVTLTLSYSDGAGSGAAQMQFSNDNAAWSGWETAAGTRAWTLSAGDGEKTVYAQYKDAAGNVSAAVISDSITLDTTAPVIALLGADPSTVECGASYADAGATASDNLAGNLTASIAVANPVNTAAPGAYTVRYNVHDGNGNSAIEVTRVVHVVDTVKPVITLSGSGPLSVQCGSIYTDAGATAGDSCAGSVVVTAGGSVNTGVVGIYTLTYNATDGVNVADEATRVVTVSDTAAPVITLTGSSTVTVECGGTYSDAGASAADVCDGGVTVTTGGTVNANVPGVYTLAYNATDGVNTADEVTRVVTVSDTAAPTILLNGPASATAECGGTYSDAGATATDACAGSVAVTTGGTVNTNVPGVYTLTYNATDGVNAAAEVTRVVTVSDTLAPVLLLSGPQAMTVECGGTFDPYAGVSAADECAGSLPITVCGPCPPCVVDTFRPGCYTVTYCADDGHGNAAPQITRSVCVVDTTPPVVALAGPASVAVECGGAYDELGATATDTCAGSLQVTIMNPVNTVEPGSYTVTYDASDGVNSAVQVTRAVTVADTTPPVISLAGAAAMTVPQGGTYTEPGATATDNCAAGLAVTVGGDAVDTAVLGAYTVRYNANDGNGNHAAEATRIVTVADATPPTGTILINNNRSATNTTNVTLALTWNDGTGSGVTRMRFSDDGAHWTVWQSLAATLAYALPSGDGHKTVRVQYLDRANNRSVPFNDYIRLDTTPPTGSIIINGGALTTSSRTVTLGLAWADGAGAGVTRMRFSDDGAHWTYWMFPESGIVHTLVGPTGYNTVRVQFLDGANNYSAVYNDYIKLLAP